VHGQVHLKSIPDEAKVDNKTIAFLMKNAMEESLKDQKVDAEELTTSLQAEVTNRHKTTVELKTIKNVLNQLETENLELKQTISKLRYTQHPGNEQHPGNPPEVKQLKDRNINIQMVSIAKFAGDEELKKLRSWSSYPAEAHYERIPGLDALRFNQEAFVGRCIAKFCSNSVSPTAQRARDEVQHYMLIRQGGLPDQNCAATSVDLGAQKTIDDCASAARVRNATDFSFGREISKGICKTQALNIDHAWYDKYSLARQNVPCPAGDWMSNPYFDSYAIKPFINKFA